MLRPDLLTRKATGCSRINLLLFRFDSYSIGAGLMMEIVSFSHGGRDVSVGKGAVNRSISLNRSPP